MAQTVTVTAVDLTPDANGDFVDFKNDTGSAITPGSHISVNNLIGVCMGKTSNGSLNVEDDDIGNMRCVGGPIYTAPLNSALSEDYPVGVKVSALGGYVRPTGTSSAVELPHFITMPKRGPVKGADNGPGLTDDAGAATGGDTFIRLKLIGEAGGTT